MINEWKKKLLSKIAHSKTLLMIVMNENEIHFSMGISFISPYWFYAAAQFFDGRQFPLKCHEIASAMDEDEGE